MFNNLTNNSPFRSLWLGGGINIPQSTDTVTITTNIVTNEAKDVHVLIIGDNYFSITQNGSLVFETPNMADANNFKYLNMFKLSLTAGNNSLSFSGKGDGWQSQTLGVIIVENTKDQVFTNPINPSTWNVLFCTEQLIGTGTTFICPAGYSYNPTTGLGEMITDISQWVLGDDVLLAVTIDSIISQQISGWSVQWGDGNAIQGTSFSNNYLHTYSISGSKTVTYNASLSDGSTIQTTQTIL
jgi:hypothetical protein